MFIKSMMPSNHLILCCHLLLPSIFPSIRVFFNESAIAFHVPYSYKLEIPYPPYLLPNHLTLSRVFREGLILTQHSTHTHSQRTENEKEITEKTKLFSLHEKILQYSIMFYSFCLDTQMKSKKLNHTYVWFVSALSNMVATSHMWLLFKLIKIK